jgi:hypothetical protein
MEETTMPVTDQSMTDEQRKSVIPVYLTRLDRGRKIHRPFIYLDPDDANQDVDRYPWLAERSDASAAA